MAIGPTHNNLIRRTAALALCVVVSLVVLGHGSVTSGSEDHDAKGSSSKKLKSQAIASIPFEQLNEQTRAKISETVNKPSIYRRLPVSSIDVDPDYFRFLVRYPEVVVNIWQLMGVTKMSSQRTGDYTVSTNDGAGTISSLELVYGTDDLHIFYGTGTYEGSVFKRKLTGKCVLVLRSEEALGPNGNSTMTSQLDVFLKIDNAAAGLLAKTIHPIIGPTADHNFLESLKFIQRLNETTQKNGPGIQRMGQRLKLTPDVQQKLNEVVDVVFQRAINAADIGEPPARTQPPQQILRDDGTQRREIFPQTGMHSAPYPGSQNAMLRARGYQAPVYSTGFTGGQAGYPPNVYSQSNARPVRAIYEAPRRYLVPPVSIQRTGWYQR